MDRRRLLLLFGFGALATVGFGKDQGKGKGKNKEKQQGGQHDSRYFRREDYRAVQRYYTCPRDLPRVCGRNTIERANCHQDGKGRFGHFLRSWFTYFTLLLRIVGWAILTAWLLCTTGKPASYS